MKCKSYRRVSSGRGTFKHHYKGEEPSTFTKKKLNKAVRRGNKILIRNEINE